MGEAINITKKALNSTVGTSGFKSLDKLIGDVKSLGSHGVKKFTSNGTFTVPAGITKIWVTACGGGQGSAYMSQKGYAGDGGDWIFKEPYAVSPGQTISITVGAGGAYASDSYAAARQGGNTIVGNLVTLVGGGKAGNMRGGKASDFLNTGGFNPATAGFAAGGRSYSNAQGGGGSLGRGGNGGSNESGILGSGASGATSSSRHTGGNGIVIIEY